MENKLDNHNNRQVQGGNVTLNLDRVLATQAELGPSIPDGGYGWLVFLAILFFQAIIPSLIVNLGIFMIFVRLEHGTSDLNTDPTLWDEKFTYVPLFLSISKTILDPLARKLSRNCTWSRCISTSGTCLVCAGLLFTWMGILEFGGVSSKLFLFAGISAGTGSALILAQCDVILSQYFRLKLKILNQIIKATIALGFMVSPTVLGHSIIDTSLLHVILCYQAILLIGLFMGFVFKKPVYSENQPKPSSYRFISNNADDEENIFSKSDVQELQMKRQISTTNTDTTEIILEPIPGTSSPSKIVGEEDWEKFDYDPISNEDIEVFNNDKVDRNQSLQDWEFFEGDEHPKDNDKQHWERFDGDSDDGDSNKNTLSLAEETSASGAFPTPLFSLSSSVNHNNTYAYDDDRDEIRVDSQNSNVFAPNVYNVNNSRSVFSTFEVLKEPTFYKSLLMIITNNYSTFIFYALFPSYLYAECPNIRLRQVAEVIGALSLVSLIFSAFSYWINVDKKRRAYILWFLCWIGSVGYLMIADCQSESLLLVGSVLVILSVTSLDHVGKGLLGEDEKNRAYGLLRVLGGLTLFIFLAIDMSFKTAFRLNAVLHFFVGTLWLANFIYKKIRI